jgi:hypothetical protein
MKLKVLIGALVWTLLVSVAHVHLNYGSDQVREIVREWLGHKRKTLEVGFIPVT